MLTKLAGTPITLKLELEDREDEPPSAEEGPRHPADSPGKGPERPAGSSAGGAALDPVEMFKNDPLIQKALKIFEGEIRSVEGPATPNGAQPA